MIDLNAVAEAIPSMAGRKLGPALRRAAREAPSGTAIVEIGSWLGAGTAQLALGIRERERRDVTLHCFDRWRAQPHEIAKAARQGLHLAPLEDTLPRVRQALQPFEVPIRYHQGDLLQARWDGEPISVYVDDASKELPAFCHALATFGPCWIPGETVLLLMDFHLWKKTGIPEHEFQRHFLEAAGDSFEPLPIAGRRRTAALAIFRYKAPLGTEAWTWLLKQALEALEAAKRESALTRMRKGIDHRLRQIQTAHPGGSRAAAARLLRRFLASQRSPGGTRR